MTVLALLDTSLLAVVQTAVPHVPLDVANFAAWAIKGLVGVAGAVILWGLKGAAESFQKSFVGFKEEMTTRMDTLDTSIAKVQTDVHTTKQELFGATGGNGIRGELREIKAEARTTKDLLSSHTVALARLADKAGVPFEHGK